MSQRGISLKRQFRWGSDSLMELELLDTCASAGRVY
jgi:hypothetical protein